MFAASRSPRRRLWLLLASGGLCLSGSGCDERFSWWKSAPPPPSAVERREIRLAWALQEPAERLPVEPAANALAPPSPVVPATPAGVDLQALRPFTDWSLPETAADALGRIGPAAVPDLVRELGSASAERRWRAARVLGRIGSDAAVAVPELIHLLRDSDERVRLAAARTLGQIGPNAADAVPELIQLLDETSVDR